MNDRKMKWQGLDCPARDKDWWKVLLNTELNFQVGKAGEILE
jgi:hypothetical protein